MSTVTLTLRAADGAVSTLAVPLPTVTPVTPPPPPGKTLPFSMGNYLANGAYAGYDKSGLDAGPTVFASVFQPRATAAQLTSASAAGPAVAAGKIPVISFQPITSGGSGVWTATNAQSYGAQLGANLVKLGPLGALAAIRCGTEANENSSGDQAPNATLYGQVIKAMSAGLKSTPGQKFTVLADLAIDPNSGTSLIPMFQAALPYVDGYGLDCYNTVAQWGSAFTNEADEWNKRWNGVNGFGFKTYFDWCLANSKPICIPEFGLGYYYGNNGQAQTPPDANTAYFQGMFNELSTHGVKVLFVDFWEDNNGLYLTGGESLPKSTAAWKATFGSLPSAPWPRS